MDKDEEVRQLSEMFKRLGADEGQSKVMARQLSKRAEQLAAREGIDHLDALKRLLDLVRSGRAGETYEP